MSMPAPEAFGTIALRVAHSVFRNAYGQQPGRTGRLRVARGIATRDYAPGLHVSSFIMYHRPGQGIPGVFAQYRRPEQCAWYAREQDRVYHRSRQSVRDTRKQDRRPGSVWRPCNDQYRVR